MGEIIKVKIRQIGTSAGVLIPQESLIKVGLNIGDKISFAILPKKKYFSGFGIAKNFKCRFKRDKKSGDLNEIIGYICMDRIF